MRSLLRRFRRTSDTLDPRLWTGVLALAPWLERLDAPRQSRLRALTARFLHEKTVTPIGALALDDGQRAMLATLCCLPLVEFGHEGLHGWSELIVYPDAFHVRRNEVDAQGVMHEWHDELIGEAWDAGPLILSWADVLADLAEPDAGTCVAVHEMAHKIDLLDGVMDGTPPLPRAWQRRWADDFQRAYDGFVDVVEGDGEPGIDPYAAEAPEEFFAVCSEYHFSDPTTLGRCMPEVAGHLRRFYGASPFAGYPEIPEIPEPAP